MTPTETATILRQFNSLAHRSAACGASGAAMAEAKKGD